MSQHYTLNTVEVSDWCKVCGTHTMHRVQNRLLGACLACEARPTAPAKPKHPESGELFDADEAELEARGLGIVN